MYLSRKYTWSATEQPLHPCTLGPATAVAAILGNLGVGAVGCPSVKPVSVTSAAVGTPVPRQGEVRAFIRRSAGSRRRVGGRRVRERRVRGRGVRILPTSAAAVAAVLVD